MLNYVTRKYNGQCEEHQIITATRAWPFTDRFLALQAKKAFDVFVFQNFTELARGRLREAIFKTRAKVVRKL